MHVFELLEKGRVLGKNLQLQREKKLGVQRRRDVLRTFFSISLNEVNDIRKYVYRDAEIIKVIFFVLVLLPCTTFLRKNSELKG